MARTRSTRTDDTDWESVTSSSSDRTTTYATPPQMPTLEPQSSSNYEVEDGSNAKIAPGVYYIVNDQNRNMVLDVAGYDSKTVLAYGKHGGDNQKWDFRRLGAGYSIRSLLDRQPELYLSVHSGAFEGGSMIVSPFPVSWEMEADAYQPGLWRIRWPDSPFVFDLPDINGNSVQLRNSYPFKPTRLWNLVPVESTPNHHRPPSNSMAKTKIVSSAPSVLSNADTIIDPEGLELGGSGEMAITTTTTTVTTSVTRIQRIGGPR